MNDTSNERQKHSAAFRLAACDQDFLLADATRGIRFQLEYLKPELALREAKIMTTVVCFGSARVGENGGGRHARWYQGAREFGRLVSREGGALRTNENGERHNVIATGGGPGLMEAANRGAHEAGAPTIGFNITLPFEQEPNPYTTPDLTFLFHYFAIRKMHLAMRANALVAFPGGFGTLDELFEIVTLRQTGKGMNIPIVLFDTAYWRRLIDFELLRTEGMIDERDIDLLTFVDDPLEAWSAIKMALSLDPH